MEEDHFRKAADAAVAMEQNAIRAEEIKQQLAAQKKMEQEKLLPSKVASNNGVVNMTTLAANIKTTF